MELIPILSTIILVATISTFLLAIGAYVLYKIRERRGQRAAVPQPAAVKAQLVSPVEAPAQKQEQLRKAMPQPVFIESEPKTKKQALVVEHYQPSVKKEPKWQQAQPKQFSGDFIRQKGFETGKQAAARTSDKFYKYTTEGYVSPKDDKQSGALRWR